MPDTRIADLLFLHPDAWLAVSDSTLHTADLKHYKVSSDIVGNNELLDQRTVFFSWRTVQIGQ